MSEKEKRGRGRPPSRVIPRIPTMPENLARVIFAAKDIRRKSPKK